MILADHTIEFVLGLKGEIDDMKDRMDLIENENKTLRAELVDMAKDPKIKGFYYCDPPEASSFEGLFTYKAEAVKNTPADSNPPCFNCDSDMSIRCFKCTDYDSCLLMIVDDEVRACDSCKLADRCFN
jgi:hypothetical protein